MTSYFIDTSALAKYYIPETGTIWLRQRIRPPAGNHVVISYLTTVEMVSLVARRQRNNPVNLTGIRNSFLSHAFTRYELVEVNNATLASARTLIMKHDLRALDAIQLMCAINAAKVAKVSLTFLSSDQDLLAAAQAEGFSVDDPTLHP